MLHSNWKFRSAESNLNFNPFNLHVAKSLTKILAFYLHSLSTWHLESSKCFTKNFTDVIPQISQIDFPNTLILEYSKYQKTISAL